MKGALIVLLMGSLVGCSLSVGAGASARVGRRPGDGALECDGFESCDVMYRSAVSRAERCSTENSDCGREDAEVARSYRMLRTRTMRELDALRADAREAADAARREECGPGQLREREP